MRKLFKTLAHALVENINEKTRLDPLDDTRWDPTTTLSALNGFREELADYSDEDRLAIVSHPFVKRLIQVLKHVESE